MSHVYVGNLDPRVIERELEDEFRVFVVTRRYTNFSSKTFDHLAISYISDFYLLVGCCSLNTLHASSGMPFLCMHAA